MEKIEEMERVKQRREEGYARRQDNRRRIRALDPTSGPRKKSRKRSKI